MNKNRVLACVDYFKTTHCAKDNTTLGDLYHNIWCYAMVKEILKEFKDFDYDTSLGELLDAIN